PRGEGLAYPVDTVSPEREGHSVDPPGSAGTGCGAGRRCREDENTYSPRAGEVRLGRWSRTWIGTSDRRSNGLATAPTGRTGRTAQRGPGRSSGDRRRANRPDRQR